MAIVLEGLNGLLFWDSGRWQFVFWSPLWLETSSSIKIEIKTDLQVLLAHLYTDPEPTEKEIEWFRNIVFSESSIQKRHSQEPQR